MMTPGTLCVFLGVKTGDTGQYMPTIMLLDKVMALTVLTASVLMDFSLLGRSRRHLEAPLSLSHSQGALRSCTFGIGYSTAVKYSLWKRSAHPFPLGWCSSGAKLPWK